MFDLQITDQRGTYTEKLKSQAADRRTQSRHPIAVHTLPPPDDRPNVLDQKLEVIPMQAPVGKSREAMCRRQEFLELQKLRESPCSQSPNDIQSAGWIMSEMR